MGAICNIARSTAGEAMKKYPCLLIATDFPPNGSGGGAAIVRQMLRDWPTDRLHWWSCQPDLDPRFGQKVSSHSIAHIPGKLNPARRFLNLKSWLIECAWAPYASRQLEATIRRVKPDCIWVVPHVWSIPPIINVVPKTGIGFHVSMHDYADANCNSQEPWALRRRGLAEKADSLFSLATTRDAICQPMLDDLFARTGKTGLILRAGLESLDFEFIANLSPRPKHEIRIAYAGTILVEEDFEFFVKALDLVRRRSLLPITLEFFGAHSYATRIWFAPSWMKEHGNLSSQVLADSLKNFTWGFCPMSLTDHNPRYNRYSLPTKFSSYLAAGLPVISMGHIESSIVKMTRAYAVGLCLINHELEPTADELEAALSDLTPLQRYHSEIERCAREQFDAVKFRRQLEAQFRTCAS